MKGSVALAIRTPVMAVGGPAEIVLGLWLLFKGVNLARWSELETQHTRNSGSPA